MKKVVFFVFAGLILASLGCYYNSDEATESATEQYSANLYSRVEIETENGEITSSVSSDSLITVTLTRWVTGIAARQHLDDISVSVTKDTVSGVLRIFVDMPTSVERSYGCDAELSLPESLYVDLVTSNGKIVSKDHKNGLLLYTSNGDINATNTAGEAGLETSNGKITINRHNGNIDGKTSNGEIDADVVMPDSAGRCILKSSNGAITLAVPDSIGATVRLETPNGDIEVDPAFNLGDMNSDEDIFEGTMGDGSGEIDVETSNGDVTLKKLL